MKKILSIGLLLLTCVARAQTFPVNNLTVSGTSSFTGQATFTLSPTGPTESPGDSSTKLATTAFVSGAVAGSATVNTNTALRALSTAVSSTVTRLGFAFAGDVPPLLYVGSLSACSLNGGNGDNGVQVQSSNGGCWIASFTPGELDSREWGVIADGTTDNTTALQAAWSYAASVNRDVLLPPSNSVNYVKFSSITAPVPANGNTGNRSALVGQGEGLTFLQSTVTGTNCAITISATFGTNSWFNDTFRDFTLSGTAYGGNGICITNVTHVSFSHVYLQTFNNGVYAVDSFDVSWIECTWVGFNNTAVDALYGSHTRPNAWTFIDPHVFFAVNYGLIFQNPSDLNIFGGDFENNNIGGTAGASAIYINGNPLDGSKGLNISGGYFSVNAGAADIFINDGGAAINGVHTISGVELQRTGTSQYVTNNIFINNAGTGTTTVNIRGNGFQGFNSYPVSASRLYVTELTPNSGNYVLNTGGNWFQSATETPSGAFWQETGWQTYTPTLSCGSGTLTSASATGLWKRLTLKTIAVQITATITTVGTCATTLNASLPTNANSSEIGNIRNTANNVSGSITTTNSSSVAQMLSATGTFPAGSGSVVLATVVYESQ